jgi:hypothetical protein
MSREALGGERALINRSGFPFQRAPFPRKLQGEMPSSALLRFELLLFARSFADAFSRKRDRLLLAIVLGLALLWLRHATSDPDGFGLPPGSELLGLAAGPVSYQWNRLAIRRLEWLAEESALAPFAAARGVRLHYSIAAQLPILVPVLIVAALAGLAGGGTAAALGLAVAAHGVGALAARVRWAPRPGNLRRDRAAGRSLNGPHTAFLALFRVQVLNSARPGRALILVLAANAVLTCAGAFLTRTAAPGAHIAATALPSLLLLAATGRSDARLAGFLAFAGYKAGFVALAVSSLPAASFAAAAAPALASGTAAPAAIVVTLALLHLGAALIAVARAWLSPGRAGRKVDLQVTVEAAGLIAVGATLPPLGVVALLARLWRLRASYRASTWLQP